MRISTSSIYNANVSVLNLQQAQLQHTQLQVATGRRMLTPSDDPAASARALEVIQSDSTNTQFATNRLAVKNTAALSDGILQGVTELLQEVRTRVVEGSGNPTAAQKQMMATEFGGRLEELMGLANSTDGIGNYLYSGFQGSTKPFSNTAAGAQYNGDDGQRLVQADSSRKIAASDSGADIFMRIKNGNGTFVVQAGAANAGSGMVSQGNVTNPALLTGNNYTVTFGGVPGAITYSVPGATPALVNLPYVSGQAISFDGMQFAVTGAPVAGDVVTVAPSQNESIFKTMSDLIVAMGTSGTQYSNSLSQAINNLDRDLNNVLSVRGSLGNRLNEIDALQTTGDNLGLTFKATLSQLQDLDYNKGISDLNLQQLSLQAAQKSFKQVSDLSLFNYI